jgi:hypothetical protein
MFTTLVQSTGVISCFALLRRKSPGKFEYILVCSSTFIARTGIYSTLRCGGCLSPWRKVLSLSSLSCHVMDDLWMAVGVFVRVASDTFAGAT